MIYFQGSVSGLYVGAPVTFRGVPVGQVDGIGIEVDSRTLDARIPVRIRLRPDVVQFDGEPDNRGHPTLVKRGLRARLAAQSFVTGQKFIDLDFLPDSPARFTRDGKQAEAEIPPMSDRFGALIDQVADLPLADTVQELRATLKEPAGDLEEHPVHARLGGEGDCRHRRGGAQDTGPWPTPRCSRCRAVPRRRGLGDAA